MLTEKIPPRENAPRKEFQNYVLYGVDTKPIYSGKMSTRKLTFNYQSAKKQMIFMLDYVGKHSTSISTIIHSFDTISCRLDRIE